MRKNTIIRKCAVVLMIVVSLCLFQAGCSCSNGNRNNSAPTSSAGVWGEESSYEVSTSSTEGVNQMTSPENGSSAGPVNGGTVEGILYVPGTYTGTAQGYAGPIDVVVEVDETHILSVRASGPSETEGIGQVALNQLPDKIVEANSTQVDGMSGATFSSKGLLEAVEDALTKAMPYE